jgi:hypothetical protein
MFPGFCGSTRITVTSLREGMLIAGLPFKSWISVHPETPDRNELRRNLIAKERD